MLPFNSFRKANFDSIVKTSLSRLLYLLIPTSYTLKMLLLDLPVIEHAHVAGMRPPLPQSIH